MDVYGKVLEIREFKWGGFIILNPFRDDGLDYQCVFHGNLPPDVKINSWVSMRCDTKHNVNIARDGTVNDMELVILDMNVTSCPEVDLPILVNEEEPSFSLDKAFDHRGLSLQTETYQDIFLKQGLLEMMFKNFFIADRSFIPIHTPKIVAGGAEGGTNVFSLDYFGRKAYLTQSPQLYKQICCAAFGKVCEVGPVFRAEKHNTSRHLNEYISLDIETVLQPKPVELLDPLYQLIELEWEFLHFIRSSFDFEMDDHVQLMMPVSKAMDILGAIELDPSSEQEKELGKWAKEMHGSDVLFLTHYHRDVRPFYTKISNDGIHTESFDCIFQGVEITSGGQRADKHQDYIDAMKRKDIDPSEFSFYLDNFRYGFPIHGGFAIGLERLTAKLCGLPNTKMASLFPRDVNRLTP